MIFIKDVLRQATIHFALSQSAKQSPKNKNLLCNATTQFGASVQFTSEYMIILTVVDIIEAQGAPSYLFHSNISPMVHGCPLEMEIRSQ